MCHSTIVYLLLPTIGTIPSSRETRKFLSARALRSYKTHSQDGLEVDLEGSGTDPTQPAVLGEQAGI